MNASENSCNNNKAGKQLLSTLMEIENNGNVNAPNVDHANQTGKRTSARLLQSRDDENDEEDEVAVGANLKQKHIQLKINELLLNSANTHTGCKQQITRWWQIRLVGLFIPDQSKSHHSLLQISHHLIQKKKAWSKIWN